MTKKYFQIREQDLYVLDYLYNKITSPIALAEIYNYYLHRKAQKTGASEPCCVADVVLFSLAELCKLFSIAYFIGEERKMGLIKIDTRYHSFKIISTTIGNAMSKAPFFVLSRFEQGTKFYSVKFSGELNEKYRNTLTNVITARQNMIDEFRHYKTEYAKKMANASIEYLRLRFISFTPKKRKPEECPNISNTNLRENLEDRVYKESNCGDSQRPTKIRFK